MRLRFLALLAFVFASTVLVPAQQTEVIADDYRNVRGINFISTHPDIATYLSSTIPLNYSDVASCVAMWRAYDDTGLVNNSKAEVASQLARIRDYGFNTVRVWLSFQYYRADSTAMKTKFADFLSLCEGNELHVIPILWDNDFWDPDPTSVPGHNEQNYRSWVRSMPGQEELDLQGLTTLKEQYVLDMLAEAAPFSKPTASNPTVILWDIMNEPEVTGSLAPIQAQFMLETIDFIKETNPDARTCVSYAGFWNHLDANQIMLAGSDGLDVMGFNFYGYGKRDIERRCDNIQAICAGLSIPAKPILVTEAGLVDSGITYPEAINLCAGVPSTFTGNQNGPGVGFCLFSANVGNIPIPYPGSNFPIQSSGDGIFYGPTYDSGGTIYVRDYVPAQGQTGIQKGTQKAMEDLYLAQTNTTLSHFFTYVQADPVTNAAFYVPMLNLPDGTDRSGVGLILTLAANQAPGSGWYQGLKDKVLQELHVATQVGFWAFSKEFNYRLSITSPNTPLVPAAVLGEMASRANYIRAQLANNPNWASEDDVLQAYEYVFQNTIDYWILGGYDSWY